MIINYHIDIYVISNSAPAMKRGPALSWDSLISMTGNKSGGQFLIYRVYFFTGHTPKSSKCWVWQNPYKKWKSKLHICIWIDPLSLFLVGLLQSSTLRTFLGGTSAKKPCIIRKCEISQRLSFPCFCCCQDKVQEPRTVTKREFQEFLDWIEIGLFFLAWCTRTGPQCSNFLRCWYRTRSLGTRWAQDF